MTSYKSFCRLTKKFINKKLHNFIYDLIQNKETGCIGCSHCEKPLKLKLSKRGIWCTDCNKYTNGLQGTLFFNKKIKDRLICMVLYCIWNNEDTMQRDIVKDIHKTDRFSSLAFGKIKKEVSKMNPKSYALHYAIYEKLQAIINKSEDKK